MLRGPPRITTRIITGGPRACCHRCATVEENRGTEDLFRWFAIVGLAGSAGPPPAATRFLPSYIMSGHSRVQTSQWQSDFVDKTFCTPVRTRFPRLLRNHSFNNPSAETLVRRLLYFGAARFYPAQVQLPVRLS